MILKSPTACINDTCINGCIPLLLSQISPSAADRYTVFSPYDLLFFCQSPTDKCLWRTMSHTQFWRKDTWIIPIHWSSSGGHWVLCVVCAPHRELLLFDSFGHLGQCAWDADVAVHFSNISDPFLLNRSQDLTRLIQCLLSLAREYAYDPRIDRAGWVAHPLAVTHSHSLVLLLFSILCYHRFSLCK